jgi:hypothetical protein
MSASMRRKPVTREQTIRGYLTLAYLAAVAGGFVVFGWAGLFVLAVASLVMAAVAWVLGHDEPTEAERDASGIRHVS